ncbi:winged helix DNA-binding protein [Sphingoaurantiacus capsulatus]|uniref:Winged helix DNA-binding protein n=1 Tax=Sphingoaurantiacus capsulatus TaxID=1771310 RepID=A0ABV7XCB9_9SPHN
MRNSQLPALEEVEKLTSQILKVVAESLAALGPPANSVRASDGMFVNVPDALRQVIKRRRAREICFSAGLFADPAWDILLDLTIARIERRDLSVTDVCIAAAVPQTTALRWIGTLERQGLVDRIPDPRDSRRVIVRLSAEGWSRMERYLAMTGIGLT